MKNTVGRHYDTRNNVEFNLISVRSQSSVRMWQTFSHKVTSSSLGTDKSRKYTTYTCFY